MSHDFQRRNLLKMLGLTAGTGLLSVFDASATNEAGEPLLLPRGDDFPPLDKPVTAICIGAGSRGNLYGNFSLQYLSQLKMVGVAEPVEVRNERYSKRHGIAEDKRFTTWEEVFKLPKFADAVIITTPDNLHYGPCMAALRAGYHVLLEKPISPSEKECRDILALSKKTGKVVGICHVLRYAPYFLKLKELVQTGAIGKLMSIQHMEPIGYEHMSHSYVRGNWHNSRETTPIILAKSCHDLDILRWIVGKPARQVQAFGSLDWFTPKNAPKGSTMRCTDGCAVEATCPYSAKRIYLQKRERAYVFDLPDDKSQHEAYILDRLKTTNYGRCVYQMDNDQPDHYTANLLFEDNVTVSFSMEAFTGYEGRRTRIMGSMGDIVGDMTGFTLTNFSTGEKTEWKETTDMHGGGDWKLVANWVQAVASNDPSKLTSTIDASIESHLMGFAAEKSRLSNTVQPVKV